MWLVVLKRYFKQTNNSLAGRVGRTLLATLVLNCLFGIGFYCAESSVQDGLSLVDSIWWAMVTMTTVGYGDYFPQTFIGRFFIAYPCFLLGIGLIGYLLGSLAESFINITAKRRKGQLHIRMQDHILICHCPSVTKVLNMIEELRATPDSAKSGIIVIDDTLGEIPTQFLKNDIQFVSGDPTDEEVLNRASVRNANGAIILAKNPGSAESDNSSFTIGTIIEMIEEETGRSIRTIVEVVSPRNQKMFERSAVDGLIVVEGVSDKMMVQEFLHPGIQKTFGQLLTNTHGSQFYNCDTTLVGHTFVELQMAALHYREDLQIIGLNRNGTPMLNPTKKIKIEADDQLLVLANSEAEFERFQLSQT